MREPIYREALGRSWKLITHHKTVWIFGVLSLLVGQIGWQNFIGGLFSAGTRFTLLYDVPASVFQGRNLVWSAWLFVILISVAALAFILAIISEGAMISSATSLFKGGKMQSLESAWHRGVDSLKNLFFLRLLRNGLLISLLLIVNNVVAGLVANYSVLSTLLLVIIVTVGISLALAISSIGIFAAGFIVESKLSFFDALHEATKLFFEHVLVSLELSLILLGIQLGVITVFLLASVWFLLPLVTFTIIAGTTGALGLILTGLFASLIIFFIAAALVGGILNAFYTGAWMHLFMKMRHEGVVSHLLHWLRLGKSSAE